MLNEVYISRVIDLHMADRLTIFDIASKSILIVMHKVCLVSPNPKGLFYCVSLIICLTYLKI